MGATCSPEVGFQWTTWHYIPKDITLKINLLEGSHFEPPEGQSRQHNNNPEKTFSELLPSNSSRHD
jgi:hypothetical protein